MIVFKFASGLKFGIQEIKPLLVPFKDRDSWSENKVLWQVIDLLWVMHYSKNRVCVFLKESWLELIHSKGLFSSFDFVN